MEITKIFSNVEDPEENLYSVLMSEEELFLFSEIQKEFSSKAQKELRRKWELEQAEKRGLKTTRPDGKVIGSSISEIRGINNRSNVDKLAERQQWIKGDPNRAGDWIKKDMRDSLSYENRVKLAENNNARKVSSNTKTSVPSVSTTPSSKSILPKTQNKVNPNGGVMNILQKNKKALAIGGGLAAAGGIGYGIYKSRQNKDNK